MSKPDSPLVRSLDMMPEWKQHKVLAAALRAAKTKRREWSSTVEEDANG